MAELSAGDRAVAAALAVIGHDAPPYAIATIARTTEPELTSARNALAFAGMFDDDGERFAHRLIASAVEEDLGPAERDRPAPRVRTDASRDRGAARRRRPAPAPFTAAR